MTQTQHDTTYNGWRNHATWAIHLHLTSDEGLYDLLRSLANHWRNQPSTSEYWTQEQSARFNLADAIAEFVDESLFDSLKVGIWESLLICDLLPGRGEVDYESIADSFLEE